MTVCAKIHMFIYIKRKGQEKVNNKFKSLSYNIILRPKTSNLVIWVRSPIWKWYIVIYHSHLHNSGALNISFLDTRLNVLSYKVYVHSFLDGCASLFPISYYSLSDIWFSTLNALKEEKQRQGILFQEVCLYLLEMLGMFYVQYRIRKPLPSKF